MSVNSYAELKAHHGHTIACVVYGNPRMPDNVAIECEDCGHVLLDFDRPKRKKTRKKPVYWTPFKPVRTFKPVPAKKKLVAKKPVKFWHSKPHGTFWQITRKIGWGTRTTDSKTVAIALKLSAAQRDRYSNELGRLHQQLDMAIEEMQNSGAAGIATYCNLPFSSNDTYADMIDHAIGLGKTFYMRALDNPALLALIEPKESYAYCFQKPYGN